MDLTPVLGATAVVGGIGALWWSLTGQRTSRATENLMAGMRPPSVDGRQLLLEQGASERLVAPMAERAAKVARRLTPAGRVDALARRLVQAGNPRGIELSQVLSIKVGLAVLGLIVGGLRMAVKPGVGSLLFLAVFVVGAYFLPDGLLVSARDRRYEQARLSTADMIDQLTVTVEAGLGLEAAIAQVARANKGPFAQELIRTLQDVQAGLPRVRALKDLTDRLDVPEVRQVVFALIESEKHGLPVAATLRVQADELRVRRRQRAEEKAMKLPVKIVFPTLLCIMPSLFIVVLGPAFINIAKSFSGG